MTSTDNSKYNHENYRTDFGFGEEWNGTFPTKRQRAFQLAEEIRRFEIQLYWKRATYFWTFIAAALGAYLLLTTSKPSVDKDMLSILVSGIGTTFSFGWYLANRGSKFWQENWENHVDNLENESVGPLYKVVLARPKVKFQNSPLLFLEAVFLGPMKISVSKINQLISGYVFLIWVVLFSDAVGNVVPCRLPVSTSSSLIILTVVAPISLLVLASTYSGVNDHVPNLRKVTMRGQNIE